MTKSYFTITAGRTGTAWLSDFLSANLKMHCIHEPLGIDDFGVTMPDIRIMRTFNHYGNNDLVKAFWKGKFDIVRQSALYAETNHTLAKCGLVENMLESDIADQATLVILRRDIVKQCVSYLVRNDFVNITIPWQWYLHPSYTRRLIDPGAFGRFGPIGPALWYCYEMESRQSYYRQQFGDRLNMVEVRLEQAVKPDGAQQFWEKLGGAGQCTLPPPANENKAKPSEDLVDTVRRIVDSINFDPEDVARRAIQCGFSFDARG